VRTSSSLPAACLVATMLVSFSGPAAAQTHARVKNPAVPGEQAPPADPGQNNFGGPITRPGHLIGPRKPQIWDVDDSGDELVLEDRYGD
jgi:hypothetical protein